MGADRPRKRVDWKKWQARGQGLVEYALILLLMAIVVLVILGSIGNIVAVNMYSKINSGFPTP